MPGPLTQLAARAQLQAEAHELRAALARAGKAHGDLVRVYEALLAGGGLPRDQLGFRTMRLHATLAPAGLVESRA